MMAAAAIVLSLAVCEYACGSESFIKFAHEAGGQRGTPPHSIITQLKEALLLCRQRGHRGGGLDAIIGGRSERAAAAPV